MYIKFLNNYALLPKRSSENAAGYDLCAAVPDRIAIAPGETIKITTGLAIAIPDGFFGAIFARSGLATNLGLRPANCVGVIDSDYRGPLIVALHNDSNETAYIYPQDRIAQLIIIPYWSKTIDFEVVKELDSTERSTGGFGSTGIK